VSKIIRFEFEALYVSFLKMYNTSIVDSRKKTFLFSPPFIKNSKLILSNGSVPTIKSLGEMANSFSELTAVTVENSTNEKRLRKIKAQYFPGMKIEYERSSDAVIERLAKDEKTFSSLDVVYFLTATRNKQPIKRHYINDSDSESYGIIMPKDNDWAPLLKQFMTEFVGSSAYRDIIAKHLGASSLKFFGIKG